MTITANWFHFYFELHKIHRVAKTRERFRLDSSETFLSEPQHDAGGSLKQKVEQKRLKPLTGCE